MHWSERQETTAQSLSRTRLPQSLWSLGFDRVADGVADEFLNRLFQPTGTEFLVDSTPNQQFKSVLGDREVESSFTDSSEFLGNGDPGDFPLGVGRERLENDFLVEATDEFRAKNAMKLGEDRAFQCREGEASRTKELPGANVARANDDESGKVVGAVIGQCDAGGIRHLKEQVPDQAMGLLDFVEKENARAIFRQHVPEAAGPASFVAHEELHMIDVEELRHIEAEHGIAAEKIAGKLERQLRFADAGRTEKQK